MISPNFRDHFWTVSGSNTHAYSSAKNVYVTLDDADYQAFLASGKLPTRILNEAELWDVLATNAPGLLDDFLFDGQVFAQPAVGQYTKAQLSKYAAAKRYAKEVGGVIVNGVPVATDDRSKQMVMGTRIAASADANFSTQWVGTDGNVYPLNAAAVVALSNAVLAHVASCFGAFAVAQAAITNGTITTLSQIDSAFA